jgi:hypothetical protein
MIFLLRVTGAQYVLVLFVVVLPPYIFYPSPPPPCERTLNTLYFISIIEASTSKRLGGDEEPIARHSMKNDF